MCFEDLIMSRNIKVRQIDGITIPFAGYSTFLRRDPKRVGFSLYYNSATVTHVFVRPRPHPTLPNNTAFRLEASNGLKDSLILLRDFGPIVTWEWEWISGIASAPDVVLFDYTFDDTKREIDENVARA